MNSDTLPFRMGRWLLYGTLVTPLLVLPQFFFPYVTFRTVLFRVLVELALGIFLWLISTRQYVHRGERDLFLWALLAFTAASGISALFSPARNRSMFGDFERMGGVWALLHFLVYYVLLRVFFRDRDWKVFLRAASVISAVVSLIGVTQYVHYFAGTVRAGTSYSAVNASIGNSGLFAMYLFFGIAFSVYLAAVSVSLRDKIAFSLIALLDFYAVILSQNRTTLLAVVVAIAVGAAIFVAVGARRRLLIFGIATILVVLLGAGFVYSISGTDTSFGRYLPPIFTKASQAGPVGAGSLRILQWKAAAKAFVDRPLLGYGPENFHLAWSAHFPTQIYALGVKDERLDRAHNAVLEVLSTTGLLGIVAFATLWIALFVGAFKTGRAGRISNSEFAILAAIHTGYFVCLLFWFFDINSVLPWIAASALLFHLACGTPLVEFQERKPVKPRMKYVLYGGLLALATSIWMHGYETLRVANLLLKTQLASSDMSTTLHNYFSAFDSPAPQTSHTYILYGRYMGSLSVAFPDIRKNRSLAPLMDTAFAKGLVEFERERERDPRNELVYVQQARLGLLAASYYGMSNYFAYSVTALQRAVALNPRRIQPRLVLAYAYMMARDYDAARAQLTQAKSIYANYGQTYYYFAQLYFSEKNYRAAAASLDTAFQMKYVGAGELYADVTRALEADKDFATAARLIENYLMTKNSGYKPGATAADKMPRGDDNIQLLARLPVMWARAGDSTRAGAAARDLSLAEPRLAPQVDAFLRDLQRNDIARWISSGTLLNVQPAGPVKPALGLTG